MSNAHIVFSIVARILTPFIILFGFYVQLHGELSPGGGFQAGVIIATAFILYALIHGLQHARELLGIETLKVMACFGVLIFLATGLASMLLGGYFLDYSVFHKDTVLAQQIGIMVVEAGIGLTVFASMTLLYYTFSGRYEAFKKRSS